MNQILISEVTVIDMVGPADSVVADVLLVDGRIAEIGVDLVPSPGVVDRMDGRGRFLIPGLWDTHCHLHKAGGGLTDPRESSIEQEAANIRAALRHGVTAVVDLGGYTDEIGFLRTGQRSGVLDGAQVMFSGATFTAPGGHPASTVFGGDACQRATRQVQTKAEARDAADQLIEQEHVDLLKATFTDHAGTPRFSADALAGLVEAGRAHGIPVVIHVDTVDDAVEALERGASGIEHIFEAPESGLDEAIDRVASLCLERDAFWTLTLAVWEGGGRAGDAEYLKGLTGTRPAADYVMNSLLDADGRWMRRGKDVREKYQRRFEAGCHAVTRMLGSGVRLAMGTDAGGAAAFHGLSVHRELAHMVAAGMTTFDALSTATRVAAEKLRRSDDYGTLEVGKIADVLLLGGDPLADIANAANLVSVIQDGRVIDVDSLSLDPVALPG